MEFVNKQISNNSLLSKVNKNHYSNYFRVVIFLLINCCFFSLQAQSSLTKIIDFETNNTPIAEALIDLSEVADINIAFHPRLFKKEQTFSGNFQQKSVGYILNQCLASTNITYKLEGGHLILYQKPPKKYILSGYIEDGKTGERLVAATIFEVNSGKGATTNDYGFFSLKIPAGKIELQASYLGYQESIKALEFKSNQKIQIPLQPSITLQEVVVTSTNFEQQQPHITLGRGKSMNLQQLATSVSMAGEPDIMRFMNTQTGVQSGADGFGGLNVRGGNSDQNLVLLDGVPIYNPSHTLGLFSIFNTHIVKSANLLKDGFSAKYGGRLSSVIDVRTKEGSTKEWAAIGEIGTLASKIIIEGPIQKEKTGVLIALRRTHLDRLIKNQSRDKKYENGFDGQASYYFYDLNAKIHHRFSNRDQLFFSFYTGQDDFNDGNVFDSDEFEGFEFSYFYQDWEQKLTWGNQIAALRWNHLFNEQLFSNTTFTISNYNYKSLNTQYDYEEDEGGNTILDDFFYTTFQSKIKDIGFKMDFEYYPSPKHKVLFGGGILYRGFKSGELEYFVDDTIIDIDEDSDIDEVEDIIDEIYDPPLFSATELDFYAEDRFAISKKLSLLAGIHFAAFVTNQKTYFSPQPRFQLKWQFQPKWTTSFSGSSMSQFLHILTTSGSSLPNDLWVPSTKNVRPQSAWQLAWITTHQSKNGWTSSLDVFYKKLDNLIAYSTDADLPSLLQFDPTFWEDKITFGEGKSYGISTALEKNKGTITGQINYNYTVSERRFDDINNSTYYPFRFTHPHEIKIGVNYQFNKVASFNLNWQYGSGQSITLIKSDARFAPLDNLSFSNLERIGSINGYRLPAYHRMDLGFYMHWKQPKVTHHLNLGVYNVYNRKNPYYLYQYEDEEFPEDNGLRQQNALPLLPSFSYRIVF